jgi:RNA 3'-terminal phosphate cyclase (ATP)
MGQSQHPTTVTVHRGATREQFKVISSMSSSSNGERDRVVLDGSRGEGGGQIVRTALTLSLLTGRSFRMVKIRANRDKPGLRPQHQKAVDAVAALGEARVIGGEVGARELTFLPGKCVPRDFSIDIGTAGSTGLVLQTLHLALALRSENPAKLLLTGGTFNPKAPAFPFLDATWRAYLKAFGMPIALTMTAAGFYPRGGGHIDVSIESATPYPFNKSRRGPLLRLIGIAGVANLRDDIARRMRDQAIERLSEHGFSVEIDLAR